MKKLPKVLSTHKKENVSNRHVVAISSGDGLCAVKNESRSSTLFFFLLFFIEATATLSRSRDEGSVDFVTPERVLGRTKKTTTTKKKKDEGR